MKITVITSNQPRHISLVERLAQLTDEVYVVQECNTVHPGKVDDFFKKSEVMQRYFENVIEAEQKVFGSPRFLPKNVRALSVKMGDLNKLHLDVLRPAMAADLFIVFGASFIKGPLVDFLIEKRALNIHMGVSPYFRGSSCNFWALYDRRPEYIGATIHLLSKGLDSGGMIFHALPKAEKSDGFLVGMKAVLASQKGLVHHIQQGTLQSLDPVPQDKTKEIRYSRISDFNDSIANEYLESPPTEDEIFDALSNREESQFLRPFIE